MTCNSSKKHSVPSLIRFFKIITKTYLEAEKLKIPNNFTRKYGGDMSNPMFLNPPDGTEWKIYWTKHDGDIWFQKGWKDFATNYFLDHGHMVLFEYKYTHTCHFELHIFDKSTLEIQYPFQFHGSQEEQDKIDQISDDSVEILDELPPCKKTRRKSLLSCKQLRTGTSGDVGRSPKLQNFPKHVNIKDEVGGTSTTESQQVEQLNLKITEAINRATTFGSKNPSFIFVMKPSYLQHGLHVPLQYAEKYLKKKRKMDILLQVLDGRTWPCKYVQGKISAGWRKFISDNNLKVGDVCLFELIKSLPLSFKVLIFRVGEGPPYPPPRGDKADGALKEANKFTSENPFFTVNLKPYSGRLYRPFVPNAFIRKYLNIKKQTLMLQFVKKLWSVRLLCYPYKGSSMLSGGWTLFTRENQLLGGDVCVFELINREDAVFDVHIFRGHC